MAAGKLKPILTETNNKLFNQRGNKTMRTQNLILAVLMTGLAWSAHAADVAGKWVGEFDSQVGHQKYTFDFKSTGDKLQAEAEAESDQGKRHVAFIDVKLTGDTLTFAEMRDIQDNQIRIDYTGKVGTNEIQFTRKVGDFGNQEFPAKREASAQVAGQSTIEKLTNDPAFFNNAKETLQKLDKAQNDISGVWHAEFDTQIGMQKYDFTLHVDGDKVTGKASADVNDEKHETELQEGKLAGDTVSFVEPLKFGDNDLRIEYTGKIKGEEISFHRKVGDVATEDFVAKRTGKTMSTTPTSGVSTNSAH